jgi:hypothetical protein
MIRLQEVIIRPFLEHENLKLHWWSFRALRKTWWWLPEVETCSHKQDNVGIFFSCVRRVIQIHWYTYFTTQQNGFNQSPYIYDISRLRVKDTWNSSVQALLPQLIVFCCSLTYGLFVLVFSQHLVLSYSHQPLYKSLYCVWCKIIFYMCMDTLHPLLYYYEYYTVLTHLLPAI